MGRKSCIKKSPTKSVKDLRSQRRRHHLRKKTTADISSSATCSTALVSSISTRVSKYKNRLLRIFSKFASFVVIDTPGSRYRGYQILEEGRGKQRIAETGDSVRKIIVFDSFLLPATTKPTVFLDLDETLIHSFPDSQPPKSFDFVVRPKIGGIETTFYVLKRPGLDDFLFRLAERFEVVVFTAGLEEYATLVLDELDKEKKLISHQLYRDSCRQIDGMYYAKDLSRTGRDLSNAVIVDDNPNSYSLQPENAIPVRPFVNDAGDEELKELGEFFFGEWFSGGGFDDVRDAVKMFVSGRIRDNVGRIGELIS